MDDDAVTFDYDARDHEIVDYRSFELPGIPGIRLRGPSPDLETGAYFSCIGAAQTMGVYVPRPFPEIVGESIGLPPLNMGIGAGWPGLFVENHPELLDWVNRGRFAILQVMSARGGATARYEPTGKVEQLRHRETGKVMNSVSAWGRVLAREPDYAAQYVAELRASWVSTNLALVERITVPTILFWFSRRSQDEPVNYSLDGNLFENMGEFPQFVDRASVEQVSKACAAYCECLSVRNSGHPLLSRFTGEPVTVDHASLAGAVTAPGKLQDKNYSGLSIARNDYYPSPEMHIDAAAVLERTIRGLGLD
jgi:hypothetical protein